MGRSIVDQLLAADVRRTFVAVADVSQSNEAMNAAAVRTPRTFIAFTSRDMAPFARS